MSLESISKIAEGARRGGKLLKIAQASRKLAKASDGEDRRRAQGALSSLLADARGVPMKIGQFLSEGEAGGAYSELTTSIEPIPLCELRASIEASLGAPIESIFSEFAESKAAASLGQVHRARLLDGREVAVKVRYPGIVAEVEAEMRIADLIPGVGPAKRWGIDIDGYRTILRDDLERELDYRSEAARQESMGNALQGGSLVVPQVISEWCREDILVQAFESGHRLEMFSHVGAEDRQDIARTLISTFFRSLFCVGEIHADPHFGNLAVRQTNDGHMQVILYDWGCTIPIEHTRSRALLKLILACRENRDVELMSAYIEMGFDGDKLASISRQLPALTAMLLEPFTSDGALNSDTWNLSARFVALLGEHRWWFRSAGPPDSVLLLRAVHGLFCQLASLKIALPWWPILEATVGKARLNTARTAPLPALPSTLAQSAHGLKAKANSLRVRVLDGGKQKVSMSMPAEVALDLENIVPEELRARVNASGVDFAQLLSQVQESGIAPQEILNIEDGTKRYLVWLE